MGQSGSGTKRLMPMTTNRTVGTTTGATDSALPIRAAAATPVAALLASLGVGETGLSQDEADMRRIRFGPNAVRTHHTRPLAVLGRQFRNPLFLLLLAAASVSFFVGERTDAVII